jgi:hypothetical protein
VAMELQPQWREMMESKYSKVCSSTPINQPLLTVNF